MSEILAAGNIGGLVDATMLPALQAKREQFYSAMLTKYISSLSEATRQRIAALQQYFMSSGTVDPMTAWHNAVVAVGQSDGETFLVMGWAVLLAVGVAMLIQRSTGA